MAEHEAAEDHIGPPRRPCPHPSLDDECCACRIERRAHNNAADALRTRPGVSGSEVSA